MLLIEPYPFYFLLKEAEEAARAAAGILAMLTVYLKGYFFIRTYAKGVI